MIERQIFITNKCQQSCHYCQVNKGNWTISIEELVTTIRKIDKGAKEDEEINIHLFGGEPLLCMDLLRNLFDNYFFPKNIKFYIATNGILLTKEVYKYFKEKKVKILLSLDGNKKINNKNRGNFDIIFSNLQEILEEGETLYGIQSTFDSQTIDFFEESFLFLSDLPVDNLCFNINKFDTYTKENFQKVILTIESLSKNFEYQKGHLFYKGKNKTPYFGILQEFPSFNSDEKIITSQSTEISNRIFLLSNMKEDTKCDSFNGDFCDICPLKNKCHPLTASNPAQITPGMCIDLILHYYIPHISQKATAPLPLSFSSMDVNEESRKLEDSQESYERILAQIAELNEKAKIYMKSLNGFNHKISLSSKCVYEKDEKIYRLEDPYNIRLRQAVREEAKKEGYNFFLEEEVVKKTSLYWITKQDKLNTLISNFVSEEDIIQKIAGDYSLNIIKLKTFITKYQIIFGGGNPGAGIDSNGKIKCFDYIINAIVDEEGRLQC